MAKLSKAFVLLLVTATAAMGQGTFSLCDVNQDSTTNVLDIQSIIDQAFDLAPPTNDLNGDGYVNVVDVEMELMAALGGACLAGPVTHAIGGVPVSIENLASPVAAGLQTLVVSSLQVSVLNSASPVTAGPQTYTAGGIPFSVLNSASPAPSTPQTYYASSLRFSLFNGVTPTAYQSLAAPSLRFLVPIDPAIVSAALWRGAQRIDGKPVCVDSDGDGICDADERLMGTSPFLADSDGDGYPDGLEIALGSDPLDPKSIPEIRPGTYFATPPISIRNKVPLAILTPNRQGALYAASNR